MIILLGQARRGAVRGKAPHQPLLRLPLQLRILVDAAWHPHRVPKRGRMGLRVVRGGAAQGDLDRGLKRVRQIREQLHHFRARLEIMLRRDTAAVAVRHDAAARNGQQRVMRLEIGGLGEKRLVGGDQRQSIAVGESDQLALDQPLLVEP